MLTYFDNGPSASGRKVLLATTAYDSPDASYTFSIARSREALTRAGVPNAYLLVQGNCHVDDARNQVVQSFLDGDCTELVFLDADVSWEPEHLVKLCSHDVDIVGGVYPYRRESGAEEMPVRMLPGKFEPDENGLLEVDGLPTGFLRIKLHVLSRMARDAERFTRDGVSYPVIFQRDIYEGGRRGGDIHFCMKWREMGGKLYAAADLRLGHCGKVVMKDSLAASLRRQLGTALSHVATQIRNGEDTTDTYREAIRKVANPFGADMDLLKSVSKMARNTDGPILEIGSGLSTIVMAAASKETVWCFEHDERYAVSTRHMAHEAGVDNIALVACPLKDGWYDVADDLAELPERFALALVDGPPRMFGDRFKFFDVLADRCEIIIVDDADTPGYAEKLTAWAHANKRGIKIDGRGAVILGVKDGTG